jgi:hypothetical protein
MFGIENHSFSIIFLSFSYHFPIIFLLFSIISSQKAGVSAMIFASEECGSPKQCRQETWLALQRFQGKAVAPKKGRQWT